MSHAVPCVTAMTSCMKPPGCSELNSQELCFLGEPRKPSLLSGPVVRLEKPRAYDSRHGFMQTVAEVHGHMRMQNHIVSMCIEMNITYLVIIFSGPSRGNPSLLSGPGLFFSKSFRPASAIMLMQAIAEVETCGSPRATLSQEHANSRCFNVCFVSRSLL